MRLPFRARRLERAVLVLDDISIRVAGRLLLDGASARIPDGARVGLVGRNGIGKTTLFRAIAGELGSSTAPSTCRRARASGGSRRRRRAARNA